MRTERGGTENSAIAGQTGKFRFGKQRKTLKIQKIKDLHFWPVNLLMINLIKRAKERCLVLMNRATAFTETKNEGIKEKCEKTEKFLLKENEAGDSLEKSEKIY